MKRLLFILACVSITLNRPLPTHAWEFDEHRAAGEIAYSSACIKLAADIPATSSQQDEEIRFRYTKIACRALPATSAYESKYFYAPLFGQSCALGGDHFDNAKDFFSDFGGRKALSLLNMGHLALINSSHFYPNVVTKWRDNHVDALNLAIAASTQPAELLRVEDFEKALFTMSFSEHFLQDSFASGHMGFNRPASGAGAAQAFHDVWNKRGRFVMNGTGETWKTFGDGYLFSVENSTGRQHLLDTEVVSVEDFLRSFVFGKYPAESERRLWQLQPDVIEAPEVSLYVPGYVWDYTKATGFQAGLLFGGEPTVVLLSTTTKMEVAREIDEPATTAFTDDTMASFSWKMKTPSDPTYIVYREWTGGRRGCRVIVGLGRSESMVTNLPGFAWENGILCPIGFTNDGLLTHQWEMAGEFTGNFNSFFIDYRLHAEVGRHYYLFAFGPAWIKSIYGPEHYSPTNFGFRATFGIGYVSKALGGGVEKAGIH